MKKQPKNKETSDHKANEDTSPCGRTPNEPGEVATTEYIRPRSASLNAELPEGEIEALIEEAAERRTEDSESCDEPPDLDAGGLPGADRVTPNEETGINDSMPQNEPALFSPPPNHQAPEVAQPRPPPEVSPKLPNFDRDAYQTGKKEYIDKLTDKALEQLAADLDAGKSETLLAYLKTMGRFYRYSLSNQILIAIQRPDATHVAGFHAWKKFNRLVNKGERGIIIFAPITRLVTVEERKIDGTTEKRQGRQIVNVKPVYVFDVRQTHGEPLPAFAHVAGDAAEPLQRLIKLYEKHGVSIAFVQHIAGGALGVSRGKSVEVLDSLPVAQKFQTAVHELAHELLHRDEERRGKMTRTVRETEAEAVAFVVCSAVGLDCSTASSDYVQLYAGTRATLEASLHAIRETAKQILDAVLPTEEEPEDEET